MAQGPAKYAVLGDSISTFQDVSPWGAAYYGPDLAPTTGVATVEDTWWMQVIRARQGRFLSNFSLSGNTVSGEGNMGGFPPPRLRQLTAAGETPDQILLYAGMNDVYFYVPPALFQAQYQLLLDRLRESYPEAQVHCGTLILGAVPGTQTPMRSFQQRMAPYNQAIRTAAAQAGAHLVDLAAQEARYEALDAFHPTGKGMAQLASLWLQAMEK